MAPWCENIRNQRVMPEEFAQAAKIFGHNSTKTRRVQIYLIFCFPSLLKLFYFLILRPPLKIRGGGLSSLAQPTIASFQHGVLESRFTWMSPGDPCKPGCRRS